ncbi:hypothetical protein OG241_24565 [Streptomyces sp. NBC_01390]|uniref:hypothetical protein n=1 Tax=Streptomyces sp. NBC_01390 TaxID=2903850 RepID=UPI003255ACCD
MHATTDNNATSARGQILEDQLLEDVLAFRLRRGPKGGPDEMAPAGGRVAKKSDGGCTPLAGIASFPVIS